MVIGHWSLVIGHWSLVLDKGLWTNDKGLWTNNNTDVIVIGSGIGGLTVAGLLAHYGKLVIVCESHNFRRREFEFDSGLSFYCGLTDAQILNSVKLVLQQN